MGVLHDGYIFRWVFSSVHRRVQDPMGFFLCIKRTSCTEGHIHTDGCIHTDGYMCTEGYIRPRGYIYVWADHKKATRQMTSKI